MESHFNAMEAMRLNKKEFIEEISKRCQMTTYAVEELYTVSSGLVAERLIEIGRASCRERVCMFV